MSHGPVRLLGLLLMALGAMYGALGFVMGVEASPSDERLREHFRRWRSAVPAGAQGLVLAGGVVVALDTLV